MISDKTLSLLVTQDWDAIIPNLFIHTIGRLKGKTVPGCFTADDYIQEAYERVHMGERNWDPNNDPDLTKYLTSVIDSLISASIKSKYNNLTEIDLTVFDPKSPENILDDLISIEYYSCVIEKIKNDEDLQMLFCCMIDYGKTKPQEIAAELDWDVPKVNNLKKRLKRVITKVLEPTDVN